jgi:restriction endonuclease-like protein
MPSSDHKSISPPLQEAIRQNIFPAARDHILDWATFKWHRTNGEPDSYLLHSSQAFCISVWGTFASSEGQAVRAVVTQLLKDTEFARAVQRYKAQLPAHLESDSRELLNEYGGTQSHLDVALPLETLSVVIESKLTEPLGTCSQKKDRHCSGIYGPKSDLKLGKDSSCRLDYQDRHRTPRLYWAIMKPLSRPDAYPLGEICPFAGAGYQVMRNIAAAARQLTTLPNASAWRAIFAFPADETTKQAIALVQSRLLEDYQSRILVLDYIELARALAKSIDPTAKALAQHMATRLRITLDAAK